MSSIDKGLARVRGARPAENRDAQIAELITHSNSAPLAIDQLPRVKLNARALHKNRIIKDEDVPASSAYKMLRTRVLQRMRRNGWVSLAVTGTCPSEGKTLTAVNLAISMARDLSTSVVLVDLDLRKPSIARYLGLSPRYGIGDYLQGAVELERVLLCPAMDRLALLLNERTFPNSSELLTSPQMTSLISQLKLGEGRIVIFDLPPLLVTDDMLAFSPLVDAILLVVSEGTTRQADLASAKELLQDVNIVGTVLNRSSENVAPYYYYYGYGKQ
ncbi:MAG TPA: CpsD/CapB family tyrosine-protein kinase [Gammaproteobacteria bacterium]|nr:CpsD/CapB family tyrosine-protein kinase [Gammaproteobacteria bacterium]